MKTVLPTTGRELEWGGVSLAVMLAIGAVVLFSACLWGWDCWQALNRKPVRAEPCDEDKNLDRLALEVDRQLDDRARRRGRSTPITDPSLDPVQTLGLNGRRAGFGGGWPT